MNARLGIRVAIGAATLTTLIVAGAAVGSPKGYKAPPPAVRANEPPAATHHDKSPPLRTIAPLPARPKGPDKNEHQLPFPALGSADTAIQSRAGTAAAPTLSQNFEGVGQGFTGPQGTFSVNSAPPDPNGAVGPTQFVEIVNSSFAVFNKSGTPIYGPVATNTLFSGFGGGCQSNDDGDATVVYDRLANRWIISQFSVSSTPFLQCVAVSTTGDATGSWYRYSFQYSNFPDYPKLGVWSDAYYETFNLFNASGTTYVGPEICAYDKAKMLTGAAATQQCFTLSSTYGGLLPSDLDGPNAPPAGSPNFILSFGTNSLLLWKFHVDWTTPSSSTLTGPATIATAAFSPACSGGGTCIPQSGTTQKLDSLADRLMYRLAYRNFGDHEALVVDHSVTAGSSVGVRWYELRSPNATPTIFQQGTYAPDSGFRWMGSIAMDGSGDMALGYSTSSSTLHPEIRYTGRLAGDTAGQMTQGEGTIIAGTGSQTGSSLSRWGDYTSMSVDPSDDCTFWYTNEYLTANGAFNWHTRIGSFKFPSCGTTANDFSISASPSSISATQGANATSTISTAVTSGSAQTVSLSATGQPSGSTVSFSPASVTAGGSSTMTVNTGTAAAGTYTITVTGTGTSATHTTTVSLTINPVVANDFSISASPSSISATQGGNATSTISTAVTSGSAQTVSLSATGQPSGSTVSFSPASVTAGGSSTMTVNTGTAAAGTYTITVTGTGTSATHTTTVSLTINPVVANDFSISASPSTLSIGQGGNGTSTISTAVTSGSAQTVGLSASGQPSGTTVSFSPASVTAGQSSTMTVTVGAATAAGTYTITVTGTGTSATHSTTVGLTVTAVGSGVVNGGFETGSLSGWTASGAFTPVIHSGGHTGSYSAQIGSSGPVNGNSTLTQTVVVPGGSSTLSFWYQPHCTDTITYDQIQAQIRSTSGTTLATLVNVCPTTTAWTQVTYNLSAYANQTVVLWFNDHDDGYATDPTFFYLDDVSISASAPPPPNPVLNPGFETGSLSSWSVSGAYSPIIHSGGHSGSYSAQIGSTGPVNGNSTLTQTMTVPPAGGTLTFWYQPHCTDTITYDQIQAQIRSTSGSTLATLVNVCPTTTAWTQVTFNMAAYAGQSVVLWFNDHDDGYATDPTYFYLDDVTIG